MRYLPGEECTRSWREGPARAKHKSEITMCLRDSKNNSPRARGGVGGKSVAFDEAVGWGEARLGRALQAEVRKYVLF